MRARRLRGLTALLVPFFVLAAFSTAIGAQSATGNPSPVVGAGGHPAVALASLAPEARPMHGRLW